MISFVFSVFSFEYGLLIRNTFSGHTYQFFGLVAKLDHDRGTNSETFYVKLLVTVRIIMLGKILRSVVGGMIISASFASFA